MGDVLVNSAQQPSAAVALVLVGYGGHAAGLQIQSFETVPNTCRWANQVLTTGDFIDTARRSAATDRKRPSCSHDHRFEAENARSRSNLFHLTMTWKRLGLNRY